MTGHCNGSSAAIQGQIGHNLPRRNALSSFSRECWVSSANDPLYLSLREVCLVFRRGGRRQCYLGLSGFSCQVSQLFARPFFLQRRPLVGILQSMIVNRIRIQEGSRCLVPRAVHAAGSKPRSGKESWVTSLKLRWSISERSGVGSPNNCGPIPPGEGANVL